MKLVESSPQRHGEEWGSGTGRRMDASKAEHSQLGKQGRRGVACGYTCMRTKHVRMNEQHAEGFFSSL